MVYSKNKGNETMDKKTKNWFGNFSLGCPIHDRGDCKAITHRDKNKDFKFYIYLLHLLLV